MTERSEFLERRKKFIGGSDCAPILGLSKWGNPLTVYLDKRGLTEDTETSDRMALGNFLEQPLIDWYCQTQNVRVISRNVAVQSAEYPFLAGTLDAEVGNEHGDEWIIDSKSIHYRLRSEWGPDGSDEIPLDALLQGHAYLFLRPKAAKVDFVALIGGDWPPRIFTVKRDDEFYCELVLPKLIAFWNDHVVPGIPPAPDFADAKTLDAIKLIYPPSAEKTEAVALAEAITVGEKEMPVSELAEAYDFLGTVAKKATEQRKKVEAALRVAMGDASKGLAGDITISRIFNRGGFRPACDIKPFDFLKLSFPKNFEKKISSGSVTALLGEGDANE